MIKLNIKYLIGLQKSIVSISLIIFGYIEISNNNKIQQIVINKKSVKTANA